MDLRSKVALVTGGAHRVGKAIAVALAEAGADIVFSYRSSVDAARTTEAELGELGVSVLAVMADVADDQSVAALAAQAEERFGGVDVLVNSAASFEQTPFAHLELADWDRVLATNLRGPLLCAKAIVPQMQRRGGGVIVNISDLSAFLPAPGMLAHGVAKAGLVALTYGLAVELGPDIRVNAVVPGPVIPPPDYGATEKRAAAEATLLKRWGSGADVGRAVRFLVEHDYITGETLRVDAGQLIAPRYEAL
jgi:NAD(P)-dependent dehydrogenase (short-subunit alcohol dehydrogenase family)